MWLEFPDMHVIRKIFQGQPDKIGSLALKVIHSRTYHKKYNNDNR